MLNTESFIKKAIKIHGDTYSYEKVIYSGTNHKVIITCRVHGDFLQTPANHLRGSGCKECAFIRVPRIRKKSTSDFKKQLKEIYGDMYDLSKVKYEGRLSNITLICKEHGDFVIQAYKIKNGAQCPKCKKKENINLFIHKAHVKHNHFYDYSKVTTINGKWEIIVTCPVHGDFEIQPLRHILGKGCPNCKQERISSEKQEQQKNKSNFDVVKVKTYLTDLKEELDKQEQKLARKKVTKEIKQMKQQAEAYAMKAALIKSEFEFIYKTELEVIEEEKKINDLIAKIKENNVPAPSPKAPIIPYFTEEEQKLTPKEREEARSKSKERAEMMRKLCRSSKKKKRNNKKKFGSNVEKKSVGMTMSVSSSNDKDKDFEKSVTPNAKLLNSIFG